MPIANVLSSYWSYIHGISDSFRNDFLNFNEMRTENRTEYSIISLIEKVECQHDQHEASEFHIIGWEYYK